MCYRCHVDNTHVRYRVVAFAVALAGVTYLDRGCISVLAPSIMRDLDLSRIQMGYAFSAFTFAYAIFEIPTAWWADRVGSRRVLARIVAWWSAFTMLTGAAFSYPHCWRSAFSSEWARRAPGPTLPAYSRAGFRGVSAGACKAFSSPARIWPADSRPLWSVSIATLMSWRLVFLSVGFVGLGWAVFWYLWFRDEPRDHPAVSAAERDLIEKERGLPAFHEGGQWLIVFRTRSLLPLCLQYVANTYGFYFFITWLPTYLSKARGLQSAELAVFSGLPLLLSVVADITGGMTTDTLSRRFGVRIGRCAVGAGAYLLAAIPHARGYSGLRCASRRNSHRRRRRTVDVHPGAILGHRHRPRRPERCRP